MTWGPLGATGRPLRAHKGETFQAFLATLRSLGYTVDFQLIQAANYGDPATREQLLIMARRGTRPIRWPEPTHTANLGPTLFGEKPRGRAAREIIDWSIPSQSIFARKRPLAPATMRRIAAGLWKFGGASAEPFLVVLRNNGHARSIDAPAPTVTAGGNHLGLCTPFLLQQQSGGAPRTVSKPVPTVATKGAIGLVEPFLVRYHGNHAGAADGESRVQSTGQPLGTVDTANRYALVEPFLVPFFGERKGQAPRAQSLDAPLPTVTSHGAGGLVEPFIVQTAHGDNPPQSGRANAARARTTDDPLFTVDGSGAGLALVQPFIAPLNHGEGDTRTYSLDHPMPTVTSGDEWGIVQPFLLKYNGHGGGPRPLSEPLDTITTKERFGLVTTQGTTYAIDIRFRMLRPPELARAQGFPDGYRFTGPRAAQVKQIGNAVPTHTAEALCTAILS